MHFYGSNDGTEINNFVYDSFQVSAFNFNKNYSEAENNFSSSYIINLLNAIIDVSKWEGKPTETEVYFLSFIMDIKHDYIKSLQHLLQGFVSDHYLFVRRAIENAQHLLFLKEKLVSDEQFKRYCELETLDFKKEFKYRKWFEAHEDRFKSEYPFKMSAYLDACALGVHTSLERKMLTQNISIDEEANMIRIDSKFHDSPLLKPPHSLMLFTCLKSMKALKISFCLFTKKEYFLSS